MKIYNTLTRRKEEFIPAVPQTARIYVCGATVYNFIHIGNGRPLVVFDTLRRYLEHKGYKVDYYTNFTDVDDKIILKANEEHVEASVISERYIKEALADYDGLNCLRATAYPKVTDEMDGIIAMIGRIIDNGYGYELDGSVFFDTAAKDDYGKLSGKNIKDQESGARVEVDERKKNAGDFVLWKPAKPGEPYWDSPWGRGRPGWHIECSQMIKHLIGDTADIHAGGSDLIFPHHENEIAQSEAANNAPLAKYWMHNGMIDFGGEKMSKSEGNFYTIRELAECYGYDVMRFYILSVHYRSPIAFTQESLRAAGNGLARLRNGYAALKEAAQEHGETAEPEDSDKAQRFVDDFERAMEDDLNTANAITAMFELVKYANANLSLVAVQRGAAALLGAMELMGGILGIKLVAEAEAADESAIEAILEERAKARADKDWKRSDELRDKLKAMGVAVKDTADGVKWYYDRG
ncbi:MAG: cysteine--tRNA ligase [Clostridiales bacterium]|jgi:cysteinyl-tRNA synthetase|nr:cysteine--tRNA ligase [Clostridiales bacterium]